MKKPAGMNCAGFSLVELLVAMAVASIVLTAIYTVYESQTRLQIAQETALSLQENLRGALLIMESEIRTAGSDPTESANARIIRAGVSEFHFTRDVTGAVVDGRDRFDGDTTDEGEDIRYTINGDGHLGRETCRPPSEGGCSGLESLLDDVDAVNFVYLDQAGNVIPVPVPAARLNDICHVQATIVVRSAQSDRGLLRRHTDRETYRNQQGQVIFGPRNDHFRRLSISTTITRRNLG